MTSPRDREVLAQQVAATLRAAACRDQVVAWNRGERDWAAATGPQAAYEAAEPLLLVCGGCPIVTECEIWAGMDKYTGIAAASAWSNGKRRPAHWVRNHAQHPRRRAS